MRIAASNEQKVVHHEGTKETKVSDIHISELRALRVLRGENEFSSSDSGGNY
jgi:hypothetical protein